MVLPSRDLGRLDGGVSAEMVLRGAASLELGRLRAGILGMAASFRRTSMEPGWRERGVSLAHLEFSSLASSGCGDWTSGEVASFIRMSMLPGWRERGPLGIAAPWCWISSWAGILAAETGCWEPLVEGWLRLGGASLGSLGCGGKEAA